MPSKPLRPCGQPGCPELTRDGYCDAHKRQTQRDYDRQRGTAAQRGYGGRWRKARLTFLKRHPLCVDCQKEDRITPATVVDHIIPHKGDRQLFWDSGNWQALCAYHHNLKTATEDGGFGRG